VKNGDFFQQSDAVRTAKGAGVVLVFANGATVKVGSDSQLAIEEFLVDPFDKEQKVSDLKREPSSSRTALNLSYGEMVGDVKKLNTSSTYSIKTPVGAAGIRGTIYRIVFRPSSDGKAFFQVQTAEGLVVVEGVATGEVPVSADKEVVVEIDTNNPSANKVVTQDIPASAKPQILSEAQAIVDALKDTVISPPAPSTPTPTTDSVPPPPPPQDPVPPPPPLSPGAGV